MRSSSLVFLVISVLLLGACGRMDVSQRKGATAAEVEDQTVMSETQAMDTLNTIPLEDDMAARGNARNSASAAGLVDLLQQLSASGQLSSSRQAIDSADLSQLTNIFSLLQSGQANSLLGLANGLVGMNGGNTTGTSSGLSKVLGILQLAAPIIATIAPQFAPIITALTTIIPLVMTFIGLFRKPKPSPSPAPSAMLIRHGAIA